MKKMLRVVLACIVCPLLISPAVASQRKTAKLQITGMYSSMRYVQEAGDVVGMEVFIVAGGDGYYATIQLAEGVPDPPVVVKLEVKGSGIEFTLPDNSGANLGKFTGRVSATGIRGKFQHAVKAEFLNRKKSYWQ
jgi:hypothetical protein